MRKRICMMCNTGLAPTVSSMRRFPSCELGGKHSANRFPRKASASTAMERQSAANAVEFALLAA
jgi:hypothetical protein